jgi:hypothetical protein
MYSFDDKIRKLAGSVKYQTLYSQEKNIGLRLFKNDYDYSPIQISFLGWLGYYYSLHFDIAMGEVSEKVLEDNIFADSYSYYKRKIRERKEKRVPIQNDKRNVKRKEVVGETSWVFKKK